jgi:tryptophan halogenase
MHICVVGGGTSGWMTVSAIIKHIPKAKITIIEPDSIGTIGVGEATVPAVSEFINVFLGFDEKDWMKECNATYKTALKFNNFVSTEETDSYFHTFTFTPIKSLDWAIMYNYGDCDKSYDEFDIGAEMSKQNKFTKKWLTDGYGYNFDASKFADFCKSYCVDKGIVLNTEKVEKVNIDSYGQIQSLDMSNGKSIEADLFVDCTGFVSILNKKTMKSEFVSFEEHLPNNNAIATRIPRGIDKDIDNFTTCQALKNGWSWSVPLYNRDGVGYVYSDEFVSKEDALIEFKEYVKNKYNINPEELDYNQLSFGGNIGYTPTAWNKNCVAIGLSSAFIEPLESTALWITTYQIQMLVENLIANNIGKSSQDLFNYRFTRTMKNFLNFVVLHYSSCSREDTEYWKKIKHSISIPNEVIENITALERQMGVPDNGVPDFGDTSWEVVRICQNIGTCNAKSIIFDAIDREEDVVGYAMNFSKRVNKLYMENKEIVSNMQTHREYLDQHIYKRPSKEDFS